MDSAFWYFRQFDGLCGELLFSSYGVRKAAILNGAGLFTDRSSNLKDVLESHAVCVDFEEGMTHRMLFREITFKMTGRKPKSDQKCLELIRKEHLMKPGIIVVGNSNEMGWKHFEVLRFLHEVYDIPVILIGAESARTRFSANRHAISGPRKQLKLFGIYKTRAEIMM